MSVTDNTSPRSPPTSSVPSPGKNWTTIPGPISSGEHMGTGSPRRYLVGLDGVGVWRRSGGDAGVPLTDPEERTAEMGMLGVDGPPEVGFAEGGSKSVLNASPGTSVGMEIGGDEPRVSLATPSSGDCGASLEVLMPSVYVPSLRGSGAAAPAKRSMAAMIPVGDTSVEDSTKQGMHNDASARCVETHPHEAGIEVIDWALHHMDKKKMGSTALGSRSELRGGPSINIDGRKVRREEEKPSLDSRTAISSPIKSSRSSMSSMVKERPEQGRIGTGTPSRARDAMRKDLAEMRERMRRSVGPLFSGFANSQQSTSFTDSRNVSVVEKNEGLQQRVSGASAAKTLKDQKPTSKPVSKVPLPGRHYVGR